MQRGFATAILLLIIVLIFGVLSYFFYFKKDSDQSLKNPIPIPSSVVESSLNTYSGGNFTFEYDKQSFSVIKDSEEEFNKRSNGNFQKNFSGYIGYAPGEFIEGVVVLNQENSFEKSPLTVWVFDNPKNLSTDNWHDSYWYYPFVWGDFSDRSDNVAPKTEITINGKMAKYGIVEYQPGKPKFIYLSNDKKMYLFKIIEDSEDTGEKILESFKLSGDRTTHHNGSIIWNVPAGSISVNDDRTLKSATSVLATESEISINHAIVSGSWGVLYGESSSLSEPITLLAHKTETGWQIIRPEDANFCQSLRAIPTDVLDQDSKDYFLGCF